MNIRCQNKNKNGNITKMMINITHGERVIRTNNQQQRTEKRVIKRKDNGSDLNHAEECVVKGKFLICKPFREL